MNTRMRVLFLASGAFALPTLRWLLGSDHQIAAVVTQPPRPKGRGRQAGRTPVGAVAQDEGLPVLTADEVNTPDFVGQLRAYQATLGLVIAFGQKLGPDLLGALPGGFINLHASLLPKYRGAAPINWAIIRGEERTGVTVFRIIERMDAGAILCSRWTYIKQDETAEELHDRLAAVGVDAVDSALQLFAEGNIPPGEPQDDSLATRAPKLSKADGVIDFARPAHDVVQHVLGMWSWPGVATRFESTDGRWENVQLARVRLVETDEAPDIPPGQIDERRYVAAQGEFIEILELKPASGKLMSWREYVNGRHVQAGDRFVTPG